MTLLDGKLRTIIIPPDSLSRSFDGLKFKPFFCPPPP